MENDPLERNDPIEDLVAEFAEQWFGGEHPNLDQFCAAHPQFDSPLRQQLERFLEIALKFGLGTNAPHRLEEEREVDTLAAELRREMNSNATTLPRSMGRYRLLRELGRGSQGVVYLAEDSVMPRHVAVKVLTHLGPLPDAVLLRFRREIEITSRLDHSGICTVYDSGLHDGMLYMVMRFVAGSSLGRRIETVRARQSTPQNQISSGQGRAQTEEFVELIERAARALHVAHQQGVIHRDIKPGNILVSGDGEPVLLDFGLARSMEESEITLTRTGDLLGTPAYMAPEQLASRGAPIDRRADIYSLAVTLYECLTLRRPHEEPTREGLYRAILTKTPFDPRRYNRAISRDLKVVLETALEKDPDRRYQTALEFAEDLRRVREIRPVHAQPPSLASSVLRWSRREPVKAGLIGLVLALTMGGGVLVTAALFATTKANQQLAIELCLSSIEHARILASSGDAALGERLLWRQFLLADHKRLGSQSELLRKVAYWGLWENYRQNPCVATRAMSGVTDLAFTASDILAVDADAIRRLRIGDLSEDKVVFTFERSPPLQKRYRCLFKGDGSRFVVLEPDGVKIRSTDTAEVIRSISYPAGTDRRATIEWGAEHLMMTAGGEVILCDANTGEWLWKHPIAESHFGFSLSLEQVLLFSRTGGGAQIWDWRRNEMLWEDHSGEAIMCIAVIPPMSLVALGRKQHIELLGGSFGPGARFPSSSGSVWVLDCDPSGRLLVAGTGDKTVRTWKLSAPTDGRVPSLNPEMVLRGHGADVEFVDVSPDGRMLVSASAEQVKLWEAEPDRALSVLNGRQDALMSAHCVRFSSDGRYLVASGEGKGAVGQEYRTGQIRIWDLQNASEAWSFHSASGLCAATVFAPDQKVMAACSYDGSVRIWTVGDWKEKRSANIFAGEASADYRLSEVAVSADGRLLSVARQDGRVQLWDFQNLSFIRELARHQGRCCSVAFSPVKRQLASGGADSTVRLQTSSAGDQWDDTAFLEHHGIVRAVAFSRDGTLLASGGDDGTIWVRHLESKQTKPLRGHGTAVLTLSFHPTDMTIASGDQAGDVRLWDVESGYELLTLRRRAPETAFCMSLEFSPDGNRLAIGYSDGTVSLWNLHYYDRHLVGNLGYQLEDLEREGAMSPERANEWRAWARTISSRSPTQR